MQADFGTGDAGHTSLRKGERVNKNSPHIEIIGNLDELQSFIFLILTKETRQKVIFQKISKKMFQISAAIANLEDLECRKDLMEMEDLIFHFEKENPRTQEFISFSQSEVAALINIARTICRRAERRIMNLPDKPAEITAYLNRLSLFLFELARNELDNG